MAALLAVAAWVVLWFRDLETWVKVLIGVGALGLILAWWLWTRRQEIGAEMQRRTDDET